MNDEEFDKLFEESMNNMLGLSNSEIINELANAAGSFRTLDEITKYMDAVLEKIYLFSCAEAWSTLAENLPVEVIFENFEGLLNKVGSYKKSTEWSERHAIEEFIEHLPEDVKREKFEDLCEFIFDKEYSVELSTQLYIMYNLPIQLKKEENYSHILNLFEDAEIDSENTRIVESYKRMVGTKVINSLSEKYIADNFEEVSKKYFSINGLSNSDITEFVAKAFRGESNGNDEKLFEMVMAQIEDYAAKANISKDIILSEIPDLLSPSFVKENVQTLTETFSLRDFKKLYPKLFEISENEVIDNEQILKNLNLVYDFIKTNSQYTWQPKEEFKNVIKSLPRIFVEENFEKCSELFDKDNVADLCLKLFDIEENQEFDEEKTKELLTFAKSKIDENYNYEIIFDKYDADECWEDIINKLPEEFIKKNSEYIVTVLGNRIPNKSREYFLQILPENIIKNYEENLNPQVTDKNLSVYKRYIEYVVSNPEMSLVTSSIGTSIFNFMNLYPNNTEPEFVEIRELLEKEKSKYELPDMNKYSEYLPENYSEDLESMADSTFDSFINDLGIIKLFDGRIPEEYCDYVIKQKLTKDSLLNQNINKYLPILKRAFEDKVQHMLAKEEIEGYTIEFFEKDGNTLGYHNKATRTIGFLEDNLLELDESNSHIINTAYHEVRHAIQAKHYNTTDFTNLDGSRYNMIKEEIIRDDENNFYKRNYTRMYCEIDARLAGTRGQAEYLKYLGISEEQVIENVGSTKRTLKEIVEENQKEEQVNTDFASNKVDRDGRIVSISQKAAELIRNKPDWLKKYPVLGLEFDENGERKKTPEILSSAISCTSPSIYDIYTKILGTGVTVSLEDSAETLEYISKLLVTREEYDDNIVDLVDLVIKNETFESLRDADINDIECRRVLSLLNTISTDNPNLEISEYIKEMLDTFSRDGKINIEMKKDSRLSDAAIETILRRDIKNREDFERVLKDLPKVIINKENKNFSLGFGFKGLFENYFKNDPTIDFNSLLEMALESVTEANREYMLEYSWDAVPNELRMKHIQGYIDLCSKYRTIDLEYAYKKVLEIGKEEIEKNPDLAEELFGEYLPQEIFPIFKMPKDKKGLEEVIEELKNRNVDDDVIEHGINLIVKNEAKEGNLESIEMLYSQLDYLKEDYKKSSAISGFFIYTPKEFQKEYLTQILRYTLLEKEHFDENTVNDTINYTKNYVRDEIFEENPDILLEIEEIQNQALEKAKSKPRENIFQETEVGTEKISEPENKIKTIEEFGERLQTLKKDNPEDWNFMWEVSSLFKKNFDKESELDYNLMLSMSLELISEGYNKDSLIEYYWNNMPEEMRLDNIKKYLEVASKYGTINLKFAANALSKFSREEFEKNPNFAEETFGEYLKPEELPFLTFPKNIAELDVAISEAESRGAKYYDIKQGIEALVETQIKNGNLESEELLYRQLELGQYQHNRKYVMSVFFIYANSNLLREKGEAVLRHALVEKAYFDEENVTNIIDEARESAEKKHPDMLPIIDEIQREALEKVQQRNQTVEVEDFSVEQAVVEIPIEIVSVKDTEKEEMLALQEIRDNVPATEISAGKNMIKFFLGKAKDIKRKIGRFFGGGDDHDNR
ncbi:MAG: hypothetical protein IJW20_01605 [Clostridia bacterium]|nr:hypothetical protein [Clostridia bacterium]